MFRMLKRESGVISEPPSLRTLHPLWEEYSFSSSSLSFFFNPFSGQLTLEFPSSSESFNGGILADEMGLGKTVMLISLFHCRPYNNNNNGMKAFLNKNDNMKLNEKNTDKNLGAITENNEISVKVEAKGEGNMKNRKKKAGTLVIVPVTLLAQWEEEIMRHSAPGSITVKFYYGGERRNDLQSSDVIITSYGNSFKKEKK